MLQNLEAGRRTEIEFINGYVVDVARRLGVPTPANAIVEAVEAIAAGRLAPDPGCSGGRSAAPGRRRRADPRAAAVGPPFAAALLYRVAARLGRLGAAPP
jgi:hypothetical protein